MHRFERILAFVGLLAVSTIAQAATAPSQILDNKEAGWTLRVFVEGGLPQMASVKDLDVITTEGVTKENSHVLLRAEGVGLVLQGKDGSTLKRVAANRADDELRPALINLWRHSALV